MYRPFFTLAVTVLVMVGFWIPPARAQERTEPAGGKQTTTTPTDKKTTEAAGQPEANKASTKDNKVKPVLVQPQDNLRDNFGRSSGVRGRPGQYVPAWSTTNVTPYSYYSGYPPIVSHGCSGGYVPAMSSWPVYNYDYYNQAVSTPMTQSSRAFFDRHPPRMRVGAYNQQTLSRLGLRPDPDESLGFITPPRRRVTPYSYPSNTQDSLIRPAFGLSR